MPHASFLASQGVAAYSAGSSCVGLIKSTAMLLCQLVHCFGLLQPLLYGAYFAVHDGIACLCCACWDSVSVSPNL